MRDLLLPRSTANKEILIDWLGEVPDDAEIGIDVGQFGQLDLLAVREGGEADMWILALDSIPYPADKADANRNRNEAKKFWRVRENMQRLLSCARPVQPSSSDF